MFETVKRSDLFSFPRQETGDRKQETEDNRRETGGGGQETEERETGDCSLTSYSKNLVF